MTITIAAIYRYPVKSLGAQSLAGTPLRAGARVPGDRRFAIAHGASRYDALAPAWQPKSSFLALVRNARLARLGTRFDEAGELLTIERDGKEVARARLSEPAGRAVIEQFLAAYMGDEARGRVRIAGAPGVAFTDTSEPLVSLIGLASIRDLERVARAKVDPVRFRANLYFDGSAPWQELGWIGRQIAIGEVRLKIEQRIGRCAATEINPKGGNRDLQVLAGLRGGFGHTDMGVYARVLNDGEISVGDVVAAEEP